MRRNSLANKTNISFENYKIDTIILRDLNEGEEKDTFSISWGISKNLNDEIQTVLKLGVEITTKERFAEVVMKGYFDLKEDMLMEEKERFLRVNGAAILYPYIRAYMSTLTSFDKEGAALIIPTANFQEMYNDELTKKSKE